MNFADNLATGQMGESVIAQWLRRRGYNVLPAYEKEIDSGKGPRLFTADTCEVSQLIAPDLFVMGGGTFKWVEAKHKSRFSWYGKGKCWVTGIDLRHFNDYCQVAEVTEVPVWLFFLHRDPRASQEDITRWGSPARCPVGLFGNDLAILRAKFSHTSDRHGPTGMIYWKETQLIRFASLENVSPEVEHRTPEQMMLLPAGV